MIWQSLSFALSDTIRKPALWQIRTVTSDGTALSDNAQIPAELRGYVQIAIDKGLFEAFPAQVVEVAPGQFQAFARTAIRAEHDR